MSALTVNYMANAHSPKFIKTTDFESLKAFYKAHFTTPRIGAKNGAMFLAASYSKGSNSRKNEGLTYNTALTLDYDSGVSIADALETWQGCELAYYTTHSHSTATAKFRIVITLSKPVPAAQYKLLADWANAKANSTFNKTSGAIDNCVKTLSQAYYLPAINTAHSLYEHGYIEGAAIDWEALDLEQYAPKPQPIPKPQPVPKPLSAAAASRKDRYIAAAVTGRFNDALSELAACADGEKHNTLLTKANYIGRFAHMLNMSDSQIIERLVGAIAPRCKSVTAAYKTAQNGLDKGKLSPDSAAEIWAKRKPRNDAEPVAHAENEKRIYIPSKPSHKYVAAQILEHGDKAGDLIRHFLAATCSPAQMPAKALKLKAEIQAEKTEKAANGFNFKALEANSDRVERLTYKEKSGKATAKDKKDIEQAKAINKDLKAIAEKIHNECQPLFALIDSQLSPAFDDFKEWQGDLLEAFKIKGAVIQNKKHPQITPNDILKNKAVCVSSSLGTGKTYAVSKLINEVKKANEHLSVLALTPRQSLTSSIAQDFGLNHYKADRHLRSTSEPVFLHDLACTLNSVPKLIPEKTHYDFIIIDEIELLISSIFSSTVKDPQTLQSRLIELSKNAGHVILLDAFITQTTLDFLGLCGIDSSETLVIQNEYKNHDKKPCDFYISANQMKAALTSHFEDKKGGVWVATNSRHESAYIHKMLENEYPNKRFLVINERTKKDPKQKAFLLNPDTECLKYSAVIASPVIESGFSVKSEHFTDVFGLFKQGSSNALACVQSMARARAAKSWHIFADTECHELPLTKQSVFSAFHDLLNKQVFAATGQNLQDLDNTTPTQQMRGNVELWNNRQSESLARSIYAFCNHLGLSINHIDDVSLAKNGKVCAKNGRELAKENRTESLLNAETISPQRAKTLTAYGTNSSAEYDSLERHTIEDFYCGAIDADTIAIDNRGKMQAAIKNLEIGTATHEQIDYITKYSDDLSAPEKSIMRLKHELFYAILPMIDSKACAYNSVDFEGKPWKETPLHDFLSNPLNLKAINAARLTHRRINTNWYKKSGALVFGELLAFFGLSKEYAGKVNVSTPPLNNNNIAKGGVVDTPPETVRVRSYIVDFAQQPAIKITEKRQTNDKNSVADMVSLTAAKIDDSEAWHERAAILEYEQGLPRVRAEMMAKATPQKAA